MVRINLLQSSLKSYRKNRVLRNDCNFLDLYKKLLHQYIPTYKIIMGLAVVVS
uniref:Uncharacterized protein n=1 Tax=Heterorhabditis bacteriophora TaxID=37862 RepID=A0A1I7WJC3_HETBA